MLSRQSGTEFASITIGDKHYIIKDDKKGTPISEEVFKAMKKNKGTLNCHAHPYIGDITPSKSDIDIAESLFWQDEFYIVSPDGLVAIYTKNGIKSSDIVKNELSEEKIGFYNILFGGENNG